MVAVTWVRAAIERERESLGEGGLGERLPALLAYEARIESVPNSPYDARDRLRFGLFLLIPLGSWFGGAIVERLLAVFLD